MRPSSDHSKATSCSATCALHTLLTKNDLPSRQCRAGVILLRGFVDMIELLHTPKTASVTTCPQCRQQERRTRESPDVLSPRNGAQATDTQHRNKQGVSP